MLNGKQQIMIKVIYIYYILILRAEWQTADHDQGNLHILYICILKVHVEWQTTHHYQDKKCMLNEKQQIWIKATYIKVHAE